MDKKKINQMLELYGFTHDVLVEYDMKVLDILPMRKVLRLKTATGDFVLKKFKLSKEELLYSFAAMKHVKQKGFPVPDIILSRNGEMFIENNGMNYFMMEWLIGREIKYSDQNDLRFATQSLATFHRKTHGFTHPYCPGKVQWGTWIGHFTERIKEMREWKSTAGKEETLFDKIYVKHADYWIEEALYAVDLLSNSRYQQISLLEQDLQGFCHHDLANHNILINDENQIALIDFDYAISDIRTHDVASLILRNMKESDWHLQRALFIVKNYYEVSQPYEGEERLIHAMLRFPQDFYELSRFYYVEKRTDVQKLQTRLLGWVKQQENRKRFLQQFERSAKHLLKTLKL